MDISTVQMEYEAALLSVDEFEAKNILDEIFFINNDLSSIEKIVYATLESIGARWEDGEVSLAQVYMAGQITENIIEGYLPSDSKDRINNPKLAICVLDDYHALGKNMVKSVLKSNGYNVIDYGKGLRVDDIVSKAIKDDIDILLISTLMISSAMNVKKVQDKLSKADSKIKVIAGGAPFRLNKNLWKEVGVYASGDNASDVIRIIERAVQS